MNLPSKIGLAILAALSLYGCSSSTDAGNVTNYWNANITYGTMTDARDQKIYRVISLSGSPLWMAENLNYATATGSYCYEGKDSFCNTYGRLYDWTTAMTACPDGWRLPTDEDWTSLLNSVGNDTLAGKRLKANNSLWDATKGIDSIGFAAIPAGDRTAEGTFNYEGEKAYWWSSTNTYQNTIFASDFELRWDDQKAKISAETKTFAFSVRCVKP